MNQFLKQQTEKKRGSLQEDWPSQYLETISCPLCKSPKYKLLYKKTYSRIVKCEHCSLIYTNPRLKSQYLKHLYTKSYFQNTNSSHFGYENYLGDKIKIIKTFSKRLKQIEKFIPRGSLLDVGCATGFFLKVAYDNKWKVEGLEISKYAANIARSQLGFNIYEKGLQEPKILGKKYTLITLWDVIEHFYDPKKELQSIHTLLKKDGLLVISTPDVGSIPSLISGHRWVGYKLSDEHLMYFSEKTIKLLLKGTGFEVIKITHVGKHVSMTMLADRISLYNKFMGSIVKKISSSFAEDFNLYVNPYDIMCVYARKKDKQ